MMIILCVFVIIIGFQSNNHNDMIGFHFVYAERIYPIGCLKYNDKSYYDYESISILSQKMIPISTHDDYLITKRLGYGKFSDVFEAIIRDKQKRRRKEQHETLEKQNEDIVFKKTLLSTKRTTDSTKTKHKASVQSGSNIIDDNKNLVVLKCLKPIHIKKVKREILILHRAKNLRNVIKLHSIVLGSTSITTHNLSKNETKIHKSSSLFSSSHHNNMMTSLILEHGGRNCQYLCRYPYQKQLSDYEIRYYMYHLLIAINGLHSIGIIHRDIKPRNILISRHQQQHQYHTTKSLLSSLILIDLGLADFYIPNQLYNVKVASRHYKCPQLLCNYQLYDYSIDMWSYGCILGSLLLLIPQKSSLMISSSSSDNADDNINRHISNSNNDDNRHIDIPSLFHGIDNNDQLYQIIRVLGIKEFLQYIHKYNITLSSTIQQNVLSKFITDDYDGMDDDYDVNDSDYDDYDKYDEKPSVDDHHLVDVDFELVKVNIDQINKVDIRKRKRKLNQYNMNNKIDRLIAYCYDQCRHSSKGDNEFIVPEKSTLPIDALDLLDKILVYDPDIRYNAKQAMAHSYFDPVREVIENEIKNQQNANEGEATKAKQHYK